VASLEFDSGSDRDPPRSPWPSGAPFAVALTHDVDRIRKTYQYVTHLRRVSGWNRLPSILRGREPYSNFVQIMELERAYGTKSTFYFLEETRPLALLRPREWTLSLGKYRFAEKPVRAAIDMLDSSGWEIGLHGSFESFRNESLLRREKQALEDVVGHEVEGVRQHYLNLDVPKTWEIQRRVGFEYDSSLGWRDRIGLEGIPNRPFSPFRDAFLVLPLAVMDGALFESERTEERARSRLLSVFARAAEEFALVVVLWHQRFVNAAEFPREYRTYEFVLRHARAAGAWMATAGEVASWWRRRGLGRP